MIEGSRFTHETSPALAGRFDGGKATTFISVDNPLLWQILVAGGGIIGFACYLLFLDGYCSDIYYGVTFFGATVLVTGFLVRWARLFEKADFEVRKLPSLNILMLVFLKLLISGLLISMGGVDSADERFEAYGSATVIVFSGVTNALLFPLGYLAARNSGTKVLVLATFIFSNLITILYAPSKSSLISLIFSLLMLRFLKRKEGGKANPISFLDLRSVLIVTSIVVLQILVSAVSFGQSFHQSLEIIVFRFVQNFDIAIYSCMIEGDAGSPHSILTYSALSILKRIDSSYYDIPFFNTSQWVLSEAMGIAREGRFVFPNDNLYTALYFSGTGTMAPLVLIGSLILVDRWMRKTFRRIKSPNKSLSIFTLAIAFSIPVLFSSVSDFVNFLLVLMLFKIFQFFYQKLIILNMPTGVETRDSLQR